jgi:hypothetical protein
LFAAFRVATLRRSVDELSWLLTRGYPEQAALKLVGDRYKLTARQRKAVARCACSQEARDDRRRRRLSPRSLRGRSIAADGFNCLIILESAYSGAVILRGSDGALRDMASVHGSYRRVEETARAIEAMGRCLARQQAAEVTWYLDRPVSNSGRLAGMLERYAGEHGWPWKVVLCNNPDASIVATGSVAASSDSWILDRCQEWIDIPALVLEADGLYGQAWVVDLGVGGALDRDAPRG